MTLQIWLLPIAILVLTTILALQPWMPLNPDAKGMLAPTTIFHSVVAI